MERFYRKLGDGTEVCFYVEGISALTDQEKKILTWLFAETFEPQLLQGTSFFSPDDREVVEIGPRLSFQTPFSTNAVSIARACQVNSVTRIEQSRRIKI